MESQEGLNRLDACHPRHHHGYQDLVDANLITEAEGLCTVVPLAPLFNVVQGEHRERRRRMLSITGFWVARGDSAWIASRS
jgi:hypothetical protein